MSEFELRELQALNLADPVAEEWDGFAMREITGQRLYGFTVHAAGREALDKCCKKYCDAKLPEPGLFANVAIAKKPATLAWAGRLQWMVRGAGLAFPDALAKCASVVDQSDGWVGLELSGWQCREVLSRLCSLDLHEGVFGTGRCARAPFEGMHGHLSCCDATAPVFSLYFQRSSARTLVDHLRHSAHGLCGTRLETA